jgi:hypothetical protein
LILLVKVITFLTLGLETGLTSFPLFLALAMVITKMKNTTFGGSRLTDNYQCLNR